MHSAIKWIIAALALLLASVVVDSARAAPRDGLRRALHPYLLPTLPGAPIQAAVLLQAADCGGNLRLFDVLQRPRVRSQLRLAVIWYAGVVNDSTLIRARLPQWTQRTPLRLVPGEVLRELGQLGHQQTPTLLVLDQEGRLRLATQSPRSSREFAGLLRIVEGLTWIDEL